MVGVLFVCLGNICRSPSAEGVFRALVSHNGLDDAISVDSAGTHAYHVGDAPDPRAQAAAKRRGVDIGNLRGRQAISRDFQRFDYVLAMDKENHRNLAQICPPGEERRLSLFLDFAPSLDESCVPDPYYGHGESGFEKVLDLIEAASEGLLEDIRQRHL
jgi:protein-tyrosine phosphatase